VGDRVSGLDARLVSMLAVAHRVNTDSLRANRFGGPAMKIFTVEEITYPGLPQNLGPEVRITNRYCDPQPVVQHYKEHLD